MDKAVSSQLGALTTTADPLLRKPVLTQALTNGDSDALLRTHVLSQALTSGDSDPLLRKPACQQESLRLMASNMRRTVETYLRTSRSIISGGHSQETLQRLNRNVKSFEAEVHQLLADAPASALKDDDCIDKPYEVLYQALTDANKRCEEFNNNMIRVADVNGDLVGTLGSLRVSNQNLQDQLDLQLAEVKRLTEECVADQIAIENEKNLHEEEREKRQNEASKKLSELDDLHNAKFQQMAHDYEERWKQTEDTLRHVVVAIKDLADKQKATKRDAHEFTLSYAEKQRKTTNELRSQIEQLGKKRKHEVEKLNDVMHSLEVKVKTEREQREADVKAWDAKYGAEVADTNEVVQRLTDELDALHANFGELKRRRHALREEEEVFEKERIDQIEEINSTIQTCILEIDNTKINVSKMKARCARDEETVEAHAKAIITLRQEIRQGEEALTANSVQMQTLQTELAEHRAAATTQQAIDMKALDEEYEKKYETEKQRIKDYAVDLQSKVKDMGSVRLELGMRDASLARQWDRLIEQKKSLQRDVIMGKSESEAADRNAEEASKIFHRTTEEFEKEISRLTDVQNEVEARTKEAQDQYSAKHIEVNTFADDWHAFNERQTAFAWKLQESLEHAEACYKETKEALKDSTALAAEAARNEAQVMSKNLQIIEDLQRKRGAALEEREAARFNTESELEQNRREHEKLCIDFDRIKQTEGSALQRARDTFSQKHFVLESQCAEMEERVKNEEAGLHAQLVTSRRDIESLDQELARVDASARESRHLLENHERILRERQDSYENTKGRLEEEIAQARQELQNALEAEKREEERQRKDERMWEAEHSSLAIEMEKTKKDLQLKIEDAERQTKGIEASFSEEKVRLSNRFRIESEEESARMEQMLRENRGLRNTIAHDSLRKEYPALEATERKACCPSLDRPNPIPQRSTPTNTTRPIRPSRVRASDLAEHLSRIENNVDERRYANRPSLDIPK